MRIRAFASVVLFFMLSGPAQAQTLLSEFTGGFGSTGWYGAWMSFQTDMTPGQGLHSVELELRNGGLAIGEVRLELYASTAGGTACWPEFTGLIETSNTVVIPVGQAFTTFEFAGLELSPDTVYFIALRDDASEGVDQSILFDYDPNFPGGGAGNNCGQLNHRILVQGAFVPPTAPAFSVPFLSPLTLLLLASLLLLVGMGRFQARRINR